MSSQSPSRPSSQTYIYTIALALSFLLQLVWPALTPLMGVVRVFALMGILVFGPLELYQLYRMAPR
ncbi:hypothetical protein CO583_03880 [Parasaccharibacter sp. TMW2.1882]|uniref:hypothetical protein n=1 Tax=Acetobacteraceae TaxID=433 RepID=UPI0013195EF6|nr:MULTISPECIES: hypothetical protein [Acetobacteraceae]MCQ0041711.1 hypothetical protein [Bombella sp.]QGT74728.1 hypothetical protein GN304_02410 [Bombella sp. ESL0368]MCK8636309.1 hypothetical protein [Parasaccharibacter sp. TMW2.1885]MCL1496649.1 hypothetical protein [Parasaccharibacter sp. TMW2.1882]MCL1510901.1 hypothetical protein [Parasaccharibacter sp. TMW 2.1884]